MPFARGLDIFVIVFVLLVILSIAMGRTISRGYAYTVERELQGWI